jgi:hypothetical protein
MAPNDGNKAINISIKVRLKIGKVFRVKSSNYYSSLK